MIVEPPAVKTPTGEILRVLLVDDSEHDRVFVRRLLENANAGYEITECPDGETALERLKDEQFSLLIADLDMPGIDGIQLIRKAAPHLERMGVMILTGSPKVSPAIQALRLNVKDYVTKEPREQLRDTLLQRIENVVKTIRLANQNEKLQQDLRLRLAHLEQIHEQLPDAVFATIKPDLTLVEINPQAAGLLKCKNPASLVGQAIGDVLQEISPTVGTTIAGQIQAGKKVRNLYVEGKPVAPGGEPRLFVLNLTPVKTKKTEWILSLRDVTPQRSSRSDGDAKGFHGLIGRDPKILEMVELIRRVAPLPTSVLIIGPTGSGKEVVARAIHAESERANKPFIAVNCTALSGEILESELFGHTRGAFTGAVTARNGRFREADGGTLFLDEIGDTRESFQTKLLRALETGEIEPVGQDRPIKVDVRIICATNKDLASLAETGKFRQDLFYRINVVRIDIPSLKERPADIPLLIEHFRIEIAKKLKKPVQVISEDAMRALGAHNWPGNVRELRHVLEHAFVVCDGKTITLRDLPAYLQSDRPGQSPARSPAATSRPTAPLASVEEPEELDELEQIQLALDRNGRKIGRAAKALNMHRSTLWRKIRQYGIEI
jgi:two-component system response regulator HydG